MLGCNQPVAAPADTGLVCGRSADLPHAPTPRDGLAPVDLLDVHGSAVVDDAGNLDMTATASFLVGEADGAAVLDFLPTPGQALLDGSPVTLTPIDATWLAGEGQVRSRQGAHWGRPGRPDYLSLLAQRKSAKASRAAARMSALPDFGLSADVNTAPGGPNDYDASLDVVIPLLDQGIAGSSQANADFHKPDLATESMEVQVRADVEKALAEWKTSRTAAAAPVRPAAADLRVRLCLTPRRLSGPRYSPRGANVSCPPCRPCSTCGHWRHRLDGPTFNMVTHESPASTKLAGLSRGTAGSRASGCRSWRGPRGSAVGA